MIIYLMMYCPAWLPIPLICKIGTTHDFWTLFKRDDHLTKAVKFGCFVTVCFVVVPFAYRIEQWFHRTFGFLKFRFYRGNGSTETYLIFAAIPALIGMGAVWGGCCWVAGQVFGFDGLGWYVCFLQVLWECAEAGWDFISRLLKQLL